ncbi:MAG: hypothetical protein AABX51_08895 [Nanoarchaeota archaeon]
MSSGSLDVEIRAYDLGGFGDVAAALRTASYLKRLGISTAIRATSLTAFDKLHLLIPDVPVLLDPTKAIIKVDIAGHYKDDRLLNQPEVPHIYAEDMDNPTNRRSSFPLHIKTGLESRGRQVDNLFGGFCENPLFYRPLREDELPTAGKRDARSQLMQIFQGKSQGLEQILDSAERIGFGHFRPNIRPDLFFNSAYIKALEAAAGAYDSGFVLGLFFDQTTEQEITEYAHKTAYTFVHRDGTVTKGSASKPVLLFLGLQDQLTTTSLFLSATMPNIVTGDLSLSDALYGILAMQGPGFFYDCPIWKKYTRNELDKILNEVSPITADIFRAGSKIHHPEGLDDSMEEVAKTLAEKDRAETYTQLMKAGIQGVINRRFGHTPITDKPTYGFYVPPGSGFLYQDAVAQVVLTLLDNPNLLQEVEEKRKKIQRYAYSYASNMKTVAAVEQDGPIIPFEPIPVFSPLLSNNEMFSLPYKINVFDKIISNALANPKLDYISPQKVPKESNYGCLINDIYNISLNPIK